jgi:hypothetical protein
MCALFCVFILANVDSQLQMEREFSFHLQLADVAPRLQMEIEFSKWAQSSHQHKRGLLQGRRVQLTGSHNSRSICN